MIARYSRTNGRVIQRTRAKSYLNKITQPPLGPVCNFVYLLFPSSFFLNPVERRVGRKINPSTFRILEPHTRVTITRRPCVRTFFLLVIIFTRIVHAIRETRGAALVCSGGDGWKARWAMFTYPLWWRQHCETHRDHVGGERRRLTRRRTN